MNEKITYIGKIGFEPENVTKKHNNQAAWKRIAMVFMDGEISEYYSWYIQKRFNLVLNKPLRGAHISFINDSNRDLSLNGKKSQKEIDALWNNVKSKWDNKIIPIMLDLNPRTDGKFWWLNVHNEYRDKLQGIRNELALGKPFFGFHMTIGYANEKNIQHSEYIHRLLTSNFIFN
jgi:hypothetical protein